MTYYRLIYSTIPNPPSSCIRNVTGQLRYEVYGWFMTNANIGFLIPITIINLGALVALYRAMIIAKDGGYVYHLSHHRPVIYDEQNDGGEQIPDDWMHKVSVRPTTVRSLKLPHLSYWFDEPLTKNHSLCKNISGKEKGIIWKRMSRLLDMITGIPHTW